MCDLMLFYDPESWQWGRLHQISFNHLFSMQPALGKAFNNAFGHGPIPVGGDSDTVFQNSYVPGGPFHHNSVSPSQRHLIDLSDLSKSRGILVPGQSGHLGSDHYGDLIQPWLRGDYFEMSLPVSANHGQDVHLLKLRPGLAKSAG